MKNSFITKTGTLALSLLLFFGCSLKMAAEKVAIIDAGSSGSRLFVYDINTTGLEKVKLLYPISKEQKKKSKGRPLSSIANHPDSVQVFLQNMTQNYKCDSIDLYILATAGMRLKPKEQADAIYDKLEKLPNTNGYYVKGAMTITGQYEGLYGWLAANFENGKLDFKKEAARPTLKYAGQPYGILEIGGASMQIAFTCLTNSHDCLTRPGIGHIYTKSYLGGGVDQIYKNTKPGKRYKFHLDLDTDLSRLYSPGTVFLGLGIPVNNVIKGMAAQTDKRTYRGKINGYVKSLKHFEDTPQNYHPRINSHYIKWVFNKMDLKGKMASPEKDSSWTIGAAIDIVINKIKPESFDHDNIK